MKFVATLKYQRTNTWIPQGQGTVNSGRQLEGLDAWWGNAFFLQSIHSGPGTQPGSIYKYRMLFPLGVRPPEPEAINSHLVSASLQTEFCQMLPFIMKQVEIMGLGDSDDTTGWTLSIYSSGKRFCHKEIIAP